MHTVALGRRSLAIPPRVGKTRSSSALRQQLSRSLGSLAPSKVVNWCQAEGYRNERAVLDPVGSEEPKYRCCCCISFGGSALVFVTGGIKTRFVPRSPSCCLLASGHGQQGPWADGRHGLGRQCRSGRVGPGLAWY